MIRLHTQVRTFCGPDASGCVANQTLKDIGCLVPCTGLYADVPADYRQDTEALEQNVIKGNLCFREDPCFKKKIKMGIAQTKNAYP